MCSTFSFRLAAGLNDLYTNDLFKRLCTASPLAMRCVVYVCMLYYESDVLFVDIHISGQALNRPMYIHVPFNGVYT